MLLCIFLAVGAFSDPEPDLPFEDDTPNEQLPFEADQPPDDHDAEPPDPDEEITQAEADIVPTATPAPSVNRPITLRSALNVCGWSEVGVLAVIILYILTYLMGRSRISSALAKRGDALRQSLTRFFAIAPPKFNSRNIHDYYALVSGRTGYQSGIVSIRFKWGCDPLGLLWSVLRGETDKIVFEFLMDPPRPPSGILHLSKEKPSFADEFKLKSFGMKQKFTIWTDFPDQRDPFVAVIREFIEENPGVLEMIELSSTNRFMTREENRFVAHIELKIVGDAAIDDFVDFAVKVADAFATLELPADVQAKNEKTRERIEKERKEGQEEEKKLSPEEIQRLERKREKKEQKRLTPKVKMVRQ
jgi:hypothetical protein